MDSLKLLILLILIQSVVNTAYSELAILDPKDLVKDNNYGQAVANTEKVIAIGTQENSNKQTQVWEKNEEGVFTKVALLFGSDQYEGTESLAIYENTIVVGSLENSNGYGAVYVFEKRSGVWTQTAKLTPDDDPQNNSFGISVAIDEDIIVVGSPFNENQGAVYLYIRDGEGWVQSEKIVSDDLGTNDRFGNSVAKWGNTIVIGAQYKDDLKGAAYIFAYSEGATTQTHKLTSSEQEISEVFGNSVSIYDSTIVVSAYGYQYQSGKVCIFEKTGGDWPLTESSLLRPEDESTKASFGWRNAIYGNTIVIGTTYAGVDYNGSVDIFTKVDGTWIRNQIFFGPSKSKLGYSLSIYGNLIVAGGPEYSAEEKEVGIVKVFGPAKPSVRSNFIVGEIGEPFNLNWFRDNYIDGNEIPLAGLRIVKIGFDLKLGDELVVEGQEIMDEDLNNLNFVQTKLSSKPVNLQWQAYNGYRWSDSISSLEIAYFRPACLS